MKLTFTCCVLALLTLAMPQAHAQAPATHTPTLADVPYGPEPGQVLDFYKASASATGKPAPVLFFIHGGGWMNGDKAKPDFLDGCMSTGVSVVSINYRLIPQAIEAKINPPVKACLDDSARALQFVRSKAVEWNIDKTRIGGCGGSAGGFNCLWLAFHPDMADPKSTDPIARESTRLSFVLAFVPQTTLDPKQIREWIPNLDYGHHAFALPSYQDFLDKRESLMPWIKEFSPYELATSDDPPVYLFYDSVPAMGQAIPENGVHSANFGVGLEEKLKSQKIDYELNYSGATVKHPDMFGYIIEKLEPWK